MSRPPGPRWLRPEAVPTERVAVLEQALGLPAELCEMLVRRGYDAPAEARRYLRPRLEHLHPPGLLPDLSFAVHRIEQAIESNERILVHGDYDVDGMSSTALLVRSLEGLGASVEGFVPDRSDGYDLGPAGLGRAVASGASLIVTADCGTTAHRAVAEAGEAGIDVIVSDHHRTGPELPDAVAVVNPNRMDSRYPFRGLSGVGVVFKIVTELFSRQGVAVERLNQHLDLVALGTVADLAPLVDENRVLVRYGLRALERSRKVGLQALLWTAELSDADRLHASDIGFRLGPRLNSAGRVGSASDGLRLLLTRDRDEAIALARRLEEENRRRRATDRRMLEEAEAKLAGSYEPARDRVVVLWEDGWHPGVLGITASRIAERLHRPTVLVSFDGDNGRGSARSIEGFHLYRAIEACAPALERFGGHEKAAGFDIRRSRLAEFVERFGEYARRELPEDRLVPSLKLDLNLDLGSLTPELARRLEYFGPFGVENRRPLLRLDRVRVEGVSRVGAEKQHLRARVVSGSPEVESALDAIGFGLGPRASALPETDYWDVVGRLHRDSWRGRERSQLHLIDLRPSEPADPRTPKTAEAIASDVETNGGPRETSDHLG